MLLTKVSYQTKKQLEAICDGITPAVVPLVCWLVAWHSGRTSVFDQRTFPVLHSTYSWRMTTYVGKEYAISQPTRHSAFHPFGDDRWVVSCN